MAVQDGSDPSPRAGRGGEDVEFATLEWVAWYNGSRLLEPLGYVQPAEFEKAYHDRHATPVSMAFLTNQGFGKAGAVHCARGDVLGCRLSRRGTEGDQKSPRQ